MNADQPNDPDRHLVLSCQQHDSARQEGPFERLYTRYERRVLAICYELTHNQEDARDARQKAFEIAFRRLDTFRFESRFSTWLYRIATNAGIDALRYARSRKTRSLERLGARQGEDRGQLALPDEKAEDPFEAPARLELGVDVDRAIRGLAPKQREVIRLRYYEDLAYEEIGECLGISIGTVKSRLHRAHEALKFWLEPTSFRHSA